MSFQGCTTGDEATSVISDEVLRESSENCRGIYKFYLGRQKLQHIKDIEGWILGKEVAAILTGGHDIAVVVPVSSLSLLTRFDAKAEIRRLLYNEKPDLNQKRKLEESISNGLANLSQTLKGS